MTEEVRATLQTLIDADLNATGQVSQGTKDAIQTQGFALSDDGKLQEARAAQPALDPAGEPVVTILFTESPHLENGQKMPLHEADALFAKLDAEHRGNGYYDKTDFRIDYIFQGEAHSYSGRQDFGDREGSLLTHIRSYQEFYLHDENWKNHVLKYQGQEAWEADHASREAFLTGEIPYMEQHCNLSRMEQEAQRLLHSGEPLPPEQTAYLTALVDYVKECRPLLNQGEPLPEPPILSDFDQSLQDYKEQVRAEVAQEAEAAGLTVEEYLASGSQAPEQPNFSIYQVPPGPEGRDYRYRSYEELRADGLTVDRANYQLVYTAPLDKGTTLDDIFRRFNMEIPSDFKGHSLSMSDIIVFRQEGQQTAYYVDEGAEYRKVPEFTQPIPAQQESPIKTAEMTTEQNYNMIDGVLNNAPTMGELEARVKAGEQVSLLDVAQATKAEAQKPKQPRRSAKTAQRQKKPSIRAQLAAAKEEQGKKPPAREKSKELEV